MRKSTFLVVSCAIAALLVQAGCNKDAGSTQDGLTPENSAEASSPQAQSAGVTLPEGTQLTVRTTVALSTNTQQAGQTFSAHLENALIHDGIEIAPKGAQVEGRIVEADKGGRVKDRASLSVQLTGLHATGGQLVEISTNSISREANATKAKDARKSGLAAA